MKYQFKFQKLLAIKENEKSQILSDYNQSVKEFEEVAEKLYEFLKKKETLEEYQQERLVGGLSIHDIRHQQHFITGLEKTISYYQKLVIKYRNKMEKIQAILTEKNIEVKKYEKIQEKDYLSFLQLNTQLENQLMDEISIQQYMNRGN